MLIRLSIFLINALLNQKVREHQKNTDNQYWIETVDLLRRREQKAYAIIKMFDKTMPNNQKAKDWMREYESSPL